MVPMVLIEIVVRGSLMRGTSFRVDGACADKTIADVKTAIRDRTGGRQAQAIARAMVTIADHSSPSSDGEIVEVPFILCKQNMRSVLLLSFG